MSDLWIYYFFWIIRRLRRSIPKYIGHYSDDIFRIWVTDNFLNVVLRKGRNFDILPSLALKIWNFVYWVTLYNFRMSLFLCPAIYLKKLYLMADFLKRRESPFNEWQNLFTRHNNVCYLLQVQWIVLTLEQDSESKPPTYSTSTCI